MYSQLSQIALVIIIIESRKGEPCHDLGSNNIDACCDPFLESLSKLYPPGPSFLTELVNSIR